ncbi:MAG: hypothetical protein WAL26_23120, partial [Mycobacterium sp.]
MISPALPSLRLLSAPVRAAVAGTRLAMTATAVAATAAGGTALLGGSVVANMGKSLAGAAPDVEALTRAAAGMAIEVLGGPPARRCSANDRRRWVEVRGLAGPNGAATEADVLAAVRSTPGVRTAFLNRSIARIVVTLDPGGPSTAELCRIVAGAERRTMA